MPHAIIADNAERLLSSRSCSFSHAVAHAHADRTDARCSTARGALHKQSPLIDGHNDYPWALREKAQRDLDKLDITKPQPAIMTDIARLHAGGVGGQFWSVYVAGGAAARRR